MIPFVLLLGCIAVLPLIPATEKFWDRNLVKLTVALVLGVPIAVWFVIGGAGWTVSHALVEYFQFIVLVGSLFVASGGIFLALIIIAVAFLPSIDMHAVESGHASVSQYIPWREFVMIAAALASFLIGDRGARFNLNRFTWTPILEVGALFIGIFVTMMPALAYLGQVAHRIPLKEISLFVFTGGLSSVLDNAPTYATFFEMASQVPGEPRVAGVAEALLIAVSLGAVMGGAITYIGNGPNFMVKSIADSANVDMPSFGGYVGWSMIHLVPILASMVLRFMTEGVWWKLLGVLVTLLVLGRAGLNVRESRLVAKKGSDSTDRASEPGE
ncbi:MAG: sodium:proton antiporter [Brevibacterium sp.]|nr:sodium:proton antiporter [Brevibacterium sp.]